MANSYERDYAFLSNGFTSIIELNGSVEWFPCPRFDSSSIFSRLLDDSKGGHFSIRPENTEYSIKSNYLDNSLVLQNEFSTDKGKLNITDFMPLGVIGISRIYESSIPFIAEIKPSFEYGLIAPSIEEVEGGMVFKNTKSKEGFEISIKGDYEILDEGIVRIKPGKGYLFGLYSRDMKYGLFGTGSSVYNDPYESLAFSLRYWSEQIPKSKRIEELQETKLKDVYYRSLSVILGLIYLPSGAAIAAATASFPEIFGKSRNWDYRYTWVRDASFAAEALTRAGNLSKAKRIISFLISVIDPGSSKSFDHPLYSIDGTYPQSEEVLNWLKGHKKSKPVRIGNEAYIQVQKDIEGEFASAFYTYIQNSGDITYLNENWWAIESIAKYTKNSWKSKSVSLWEERAHGESYVHTKVMEWTALDRAYKLALIAGETDSAEDWKAVSKEIRDEVLAQGISEKQKCFVNYYGSEEVDAALLTLPIYDFVKADDPIFMATLKKIENDLSIGDGMYIRYRNDFIGEVAHPFTLINTWVSRVYTRLGENNKAIGALSRLAEHSMSLNLFSEHVEQSTREPRGNFPQLFPHAGFVEALTEYKEKFHSI